MCDLEELKKRTLILTQTDPQTDMMFRTWIDNKMNADIIFSPKPKILRAIRRMWTDGFLPGDEFWYGDWKNDLEKYDTVILHASERTRRIPTYIHKRKPSMRIIYWYWNRVNADSRPELAWDKNIEPWSFDKDDCVQYGMKQNIQYYQYPSDVKNEPIEYDLYFIGHDHNRAAQILQIQQEAEKQGLTVKIEIIDQGAGNVPYTEVQRRTARTKAILEVMQSGQVGCTLRALESLFFRKKLVTTNLEIQKEAFYNPNNIFIWGKAPSDRLYDFINNPYDSSADQYRKQYTLDTWFLNFFTQEC